jgi:hypothetical protein
MQAPAGRDGGSWYRGDLDFPPLRQTGSLRSLAKTKRQYVVARWPTVNHRATAHKDMIPARIRSSRYDSGRGRSAQHELIPDAKLSPNSGSPTRESTRTSNTPRARRALKHRAAGAPRKLSRLHKPETMSPDAWQIALRRQLGREETFALTNIGERPIFSEFHVTNPKSGNSYRVAIRGSSTGSNFCSCPDFATNTLGTCKHVEFTLTQLERRRGARAALVRGWIPPYSEIYVQYGARREVRFRPRADAPAALLRLVRRHFDSDGVLRPRAAGHFERFVAEATRIDPGCRCYEDALALVAQMRDEERRATRLAAAFPHGTRSTAFKRLLRIELHDYQRQAALGPADASSRTTWDSARRSRPSPRSRSWPGTSASNGRWWCVRRRSSTSGSVRSPARSAADGCGRRLPRAPGGWVQSRELLQDDQLRRRAPGLGSDQGMVAGRCDPRRGPSASRTGRRARPRASRRLRRPTRSC